MHPIVRAALYEDLAPGERQARHAAAAEALAAEGASAERVTAHLLLTVPTGDQQPGRHAQVGGDRRGAPWRSARGRRTRLRRALAESPAGQERAEILTELGRYEVATMQFEAAEEHLRASLESGAALTTRAEAASWLGRCAIVSGGRSARCRGRRTGVAGRGACGRSIASARSSSAPSCLMLTTSVPHLRDGHAEHLQRFRDQARGHPGFEAVARIHGAHEQL